MVEFLNANLGNILLLVIAIIAIIVAIKLKYVKQVKQILLYLVTKAEKEYGDGTGKLKLSAVSEWVYEKLPSLARVFISADLIEELINKAVEEMKEYLADNTKANAIVKSNNIVK